MTPISVLLERIEENRGQTRRFLNYLKLLAGAEARERGTSPEVELARLAAADPSGGKGLGTIGWHLLHVAVYEEGCFGDGPRPELFGRFQHGNPPFVPEAPLAEIESDLESSRAALLRRTAEWDEAMLDAVPPGFPTGGDTYGRLLESIAWHEPHHLAICNENLRAQFIES